MVHVVQLLLEPLNNLMDWGRGTRQFLVAVSAVRAIGTKPQLIPVKRGAGWCKYHCQELSKGSVTLFQVSDFIHAPLYVRGCRRSGCNLQNLGINRPRLPQRRLRVPATFIPIKNYVHSEKKMQGGLIGFNKQYLVQLRS
jgi:hypothetical protein